MITKVSSELFVENNEDFEGLKPSKTTNSTIFDIRKILLVKEISSPKARWSFVKLSMKILFAPITILAYLINELFSRIAALYGLGSEQEIKNIDLIKRDKLLDVGGEQIFFGFDKKPLLEGMFFQTNSPTANTKTILICAGSRRSYENFTIPMVDAFMSMGHNVMVFNYEGFGKSEGVASEKGVYRSVKTAYQYLVQEKGCQDEDIIAWGYSLGSGAVTKLALKHKINIVLDRGFSSMSEAAYHSAPWGLKNIARFIFTIGANFDNLSKLKKIKGKILIAQGIYDKVMNHGKYLYDAILKNPDAIYMTVDSWHIHTDDEVWFTKGKDRVFVEDFLNQA